MNKLFKNKKPALVLIDLVFVSVTTLVNIQNANDKNRERKPT